ncbi:MAG: SDR family oxidoreductase [Acidimicrobiia bacterium]|nr:SDR family oxidoreductase [Acidimicrobiia bacterium]
MAEDRVTVVTGASQGIGRELAVAFGAERDAVVLAARNVEGLAETAGAVTDAGGEPFVVPTDITDPTSVEALATSVLERHGRVDVLVNNSGVGGPSGRLWELDPQDWADTFAVNVYGVFLVSRVLLPSMIDHRAGSVINIGSISGKRPLYGRSAYTSTKLALVGLTRTLALEAGPYGVRVNLISPGFVAGARLDWVLSAQAQTRGISPEAVRAEFAGESPLNRLTEAKDIADTAVFLASDAARAITGADLNVNSGVVMY